MLVTEERKKNFDFASPTCEAVTVYATKKGAPIKTADDLVGKVVGAETGRAMLADLKSFNEELKNPAGGPVAFFNRVSLVDPKTKERLLPVFYSDNYVSVLPGESKTITLDYTPKAGVTPEVSVRGWNLTEKNYPVK